MDIGIDGQNGLLADLSYARLSLFSLSSQVELGISDIEYIYDVIRPHIV